MNCKLVLIWIFPFNSKNNVYSEMTIIYIPIRPSRQNYNLDEKDNTDE